MLFLSLPNGEKSFLLSHLGGYLPVGSWDRFVPKGAPVLMLIWARFGLRGTDTPRAKHLRQMLRIANHANHFVFGIKALCPKGK